MLTPLHHDKVFQIQAVKCSGSVRNKRGGWNPADLKNQYDDPLLPSVLCISLWAHIQRHSFAVTYNNHITFLICIYIYIFFFFPSLNERFQTAFLWQRVQGYRGLEQHWEIAAVASLQHKRQFSFFITS